MITTYGSTNNNNEHTDTSNTLQGAKNYATRNGYNTVSQRAGYNVFIKANKINGKWINK